MLFDSEHLFRQHGKHERKLGVYWTYSWHWTGREWLHAATVRGEESRAAAYTKLHVRSFDNHLEWLRTSKRDEIRCTSASKIDDPTGG